MKTKATVGLLARFPFDWKNPRGFLMAAIITYAIAQIAITYAAYLIAYGVGMNLYIVAFTEDIKRHLRAMNEGIKAGANRTDINRQIAEYIQIHSDSKQLMANLFTNFIQSISYLNNIAFHLQHNGPFRGFSAADVCSGICVEFDHNLRCNVDDSN